MWAVFDLGNSYLGPFLARPILLRPSSTQANFDFDFGLNILGGFGGVLCLRVLVSRVGTRIGRGRI